jgi:hypothetical protein
LRLAILLSVNRLHHSLALRRGRRIGPIIALALITGCRAVVPPWGPTLAEARVNADNLLTAFEVRFTNVRRDALFGAARPKMGRHALTPGGLFRDSTIWTIRNSPDSSRALYLEAALDSRGYLFASRTNAPYPSKLGAQRHYIRLQKLPNDRYEWVTIVDHAIGTAKPADIANGFTTLLTSFEGRTGDALLSELASSFPRTSRHMGQLFGIDSLRTVRHEDGSTSFALSVRFRADSLRRTYPAFAAYVDKYVVPTVHRTQLLDRSGTPYFELGGGPGQFTIRLRAHRGKLVTLHGPPRPMPDTLQVRVDFSAKFKIFRVGFSNLVGDFIITRGPNERGWFTRFQREPRWHFPLAANQLIKNPLKTPFEGRGSEMRLVIRDDLGPQTMSLRHMRTVVNESAIMRWLGGLGGTAFGDFEGKSEAEENRFLVLMFEALRRDFSDYRP